MSQFSPLRDPVFLLTWQVHLAVVTLFALLAIWAGMTRRPWYVAPTLFLALLWLFVPLEAPEPVVVLLLTAPVLAVACRIARRWLEGPREEPNESSSSRWRFSLSDLLWLTVIVGLGTALLMQVWRMPWRIHWPDVALSACFFSVLGVMTLVMTHQTTWKRRLLAATLLIAVIGVAVWTHQVLLEKDWLLLSEWETLVALPLAARPFARCDPFPVYLLTFLQWPVVLGLGLQVLLPPPASRPPSYASMVRKIAGGSLLLTLVLGLTWIYVGMLDRPSPPDEQWLEVNEREAFWAILDRHRQLNRREESLDALRASAGAASAQGVTDLLAELDQLLRRGSITQFDSRSDEPDPSTNLVSVQGARGLVGMLAAQANADWRAGKREEALAHDLLALRLAEAFERRGIMLDAMVGTALEEMALRPIGKFRAELTIAENQQIADFLDQLAAGREPLDLLFARERYFADRAGGWRGRVTAAANRILGGERKADDQLKFLFSRRDAMLSLLRADLAIRRYQQKHGVWPENLLALVPEELDSVPLDPFSQQPPIYRVAGDGFVLYSVGPDGVDDGGNIANWQQRHTSGYDLDLETSWYFQ